MKQTHHKQQRQISLNEKSPSLQPRSQAHWILFCLGSCPITELAWRSHTKLEAKLWYD